MSNHQNATTLHLLCGKMAAGKSTLDASVAQRENLLLVSEDKLLATLYPAEITDVTGYVKYSKRLHHALENILVQLLQQGNSMVMDFPANTAAQRAWLVGLANAAGVSHQLHYIDLPDDVCKAQLQKRAEAQPERAATDTVAMFDAITRYFEAPDKSEGINIVKVNPAAKL
ncbi:MAG: ATP-binding protein [Pseudomonadota bacterium]